MDPLNFVPAKVLGFKVKTRWQISFHYLVPCTIELFVFIAIMVTDSGIIYQHYRDRNYLFAALTLSAIVVPAILCFICVMLSDQWPVEKGDKCTFFARQLMNLFLFPIAAIYKFSRKIFWCVESLFHDKNTYERHQAIVKAAEHSPFELYHFLQSFFHCGPQIILQLYILLRENQFRNYETCELMEKVCHSIAQ